MSLDVLFGILPKGIVTPSQLIYRRRVAKAEASSKSLDAGEEQDAKSELADDELQTDKESTYLSRISKRFRGRGSSNSGHFDEKA